jgi:ssDNA-binding Zn-finger/Zn-ribbon topoisomerase 1
MRVKRNRNTGEFFLACNSYPGCKGTRPFDLIEYIKELIRDEIANELNLQKARKSLAEINKIPGKEWKARKKRQKLLNKAQSISANQIHVVSNPHGYTND